MSSVITLAIAVSVQDRPSAAPATGDWSPDIVLVGNPPFLLLLVPYPTSFSPSPVLPTFSISLRK